ncbi:MAG: hypothetical protein COV52_03435 [Gammaproteobacteria bacterium CG11_big_fil_rev_8_21_14_0_20_46_22]|nr:MAG: hypothetical protein COW05_09700 [Gammaproteobacteria bacterium CG12_big_fil_rev_8_21_14_0_65_46_12]PIR11526.1 MAG: hypothetical protein COV52_03435 [Gammaproteobacteria bacterium CG11_big_fil_rev_8_21_14_0_20_46_22]
MFNSAIDLLHSSGIVKGRETHLKARLVVALILLVLSALGVFMTDFAPEEMAWKYWVYVTPLFAVICIVLSWIVSRHHELSFTIVWHEILHWIGLLGAIYLVSLVISSGIISFLVGGIFALTLLSLAMFLAGVHFDSMYLVIGILLGFLVVIQTLLVKYLTFILIPLIVIVALFFFWRYRHGKKTDNAPKQEKSEKTVQNQTHHSDDEL